VLTSRGVISIRSAILSLKEKRDALQNLDRYVCSGGSCRGKNPAPGGRHFFLVLGLRLAGKRELAQLNPFDLVVLLTLSNTVQNAIIGDDNTITGGIIGASTLLLVNYLVVRFLYRHRRLDRFVEGEACVLIENGKIQEHQLAREVLTRQELEAAAHKQGFGNLREVEKAVLEPGGTISFTAKKPAPEETRHQEILQRLDQLSRELTQLRLRDAPPTA
jgi:uncharacterized membrane protein YcaP (DUF421 family)